jgi:hypothetical protein
MWRYQSALRVASPCVIKEWGWLTPCSASPLGVLLSPFKASYFSIICQAGSGVKSFLKAYFQFLLKKFPYRNVKINFRKNDFLTLLM